MKHINMWAILNGQTLKPIAMFKSKREANNRLKEEIAGCNWFVLFRKIKVKVPEHKEI